MASVLRDGADEPGTIVIAQAYGLSGGHVYSVLVRYADGRTEVEGDRISELGVAASVAWRLADELGLDLARDDRCPPKSVEIINGERMEISISILPGGLLSDDNVPDERQWLSKWIERLR